ncbi:hypothetical protein KK471_30735, partial [Klebsiella pneumoniae]|uniref:hypothetical protein n=1 Tax=Klebsiella pneumoniae TaxID=573 RepID=UPI001BE0A179
ERLGLIHLKTILWLRLNPPRVLELKPFELCPKNQIKSAKSSGKLPKMQNWLEDPSDHPRLDV